MSTPFAMSNTTVDSSAVVADPTTSAIFTSETTFVTSPTTTAAVPTTTSAVDTPTTTSTTPVTEPTTTSETSPTAAATTSVPTTSTTSTSEAAAPTTSAESTSAEVLTTVIVVTPSGTTGNAQPTTIYVTSTASNAAGTGTSVDGGSASSTSSGGATLATGSGGSSSSSGLSVGGKIAIAVVVPIVAIAGIAALLLFFWKKRKARKAEEEERKQEMEEYGFNPNNDPTLPPVGGTSVGDDSEVREDGAGYRGWGTTTNSNRKASTTLSSGRGLGGMAYSDEGSSQPGGYNYVHPHSPSEQDTFVNEPTNNNYDNRPASDEYNNGIGTAIGGGAALGGATAAGQDNKDMHRGLSNASSGYSGRPHSDAASEGTDGLHGNYNDYYEMQPQHGPYGDGTYGGGQPVIRDVQARRNTRIEKPSVFPHSGNSGIAANF